LYVLHVIIRCDVYVRYILMNATNIVINKNAIFDKHVYLKKSIYVFIYKHL